MFKISVMMFDLLKPYGLEFVSRTYVGLFLFVSIGLPLYRLGRTVNDTSEFRAAVATRGRVFLAAAALILLALFLVPWTESIRRSAALEHARVERISAAASGFLTGVSVSQGEMVSSGQELGRLVNQDIEAKLASLRLQREAIAVRLRALSGESSEEARLTLPVLQRQAREVDEELSAVEHKADTLLLRAPRAGIVRTPRPEELVGRHFPANQPVLELGVAGEPRLLIALDEKQARKVRPGQSVRVIFNGLPGDVFTGEIVSAPVSPVAGFSAPSFSNLLGGDIPAEAGKDQRTIVPSISYFEAEARVDIPQDKLDCLRPQASGRARIDIRETTLAGWLRDRLYDAVNPQIRL
jgi:multidrug resistance efflux pump